MNIEQRSLFGVKESPMEKVKPLPAPKAPFPKLTLDYGFDNTELKAEAVFWLRLMIGQNVKNLANPKAKRHFIKNVLSELKLKQGISCPENIVREMLLMKNL
jgi:hypothetical protein